MKQLMITSLSEEQLLKNVPKKYHTIPIYTIKGETNNNNVLPCHWDKISSLFEQNDHIIISHLHTVNDDLFQGKNMHMTEFIILLCLKGARLYNKKLSYLRTGNAQPITKMEDIHFMEQQNDKNDLNVITRKTVTSIQKINTPVNKSALSWVQHYFSWLEKFTLHIIKVVKEKNTYAFYARGIKKPLLTLRQNRAIHDDDIVELIIAGGFLNRERKLKKPLGRFFFVTSKNRKTLYTSLVHFHPQLPWTLYRLSQGIVHKIVMYFFNKYIEKMQK